MKYLKKTTVTALASLMAATAMLPSCNEKKDSDLELEPVNLAVTSFALKSSLGTQEIDTVFFSIDLNRGLIFNADSLRKGTDVSKVVANIKFGSGVSEAVIEMEGGTTRTGEIDYKKNPTDSIDFTGNVILRIKADDSNLSASYRIKVNIHTIDTDTLFWSETAVRKLPSRLGAPVRQKTVSRGDEIFSFIEENDGTYTLSTTSTPSEDNWAKQSLNLSFIPDVGSMSATTDALWILSENGELFTSSDGGTTWSVVDNDWESLIGNYGDTVLGIKKQGDTKTFAQFPELDIAKVTIPTDFPVQGGSNFVTLTNKWTLSPVGFFTGGTTASGKLSNSTWAFDGTDWIKLSSGGIPRLEGASVIPYYNFRASSQSNAMLRYNVWMLVGGRMEDGSFNRTVYISYDNGVNWTKGVSSLQLPKSIPAMTQCDNVVHNTEMQANLSDIWKVKRAVRSRAEYEIAGDVITWGCPYIYLFGGYAPDGKLYDTIWRGVLTRLTFTPIF